MINSSRNPYGIKTDSTKSREQNKIRRANFIPTFGKHIHVLA